MPIQPFCTKILRERDAPNLPPPEDRHVKVACLAFDGKTIGEIRSEFPRISVQMIGQSIRLTRDAVRRGKPPDEVLRFPELIEEQVAYKVAPGKPSKASATTRALKSLSTALVKIEFKSFPDFVRSVKERFAPIGVPLIVQKMLEGVEREDPEMIKLSTQVFDLAPKGKGLTLQQQFNIPGGTPEKRPNADHRVAFFEELVRKNRAKIDSATPAATAVIDAETVEGSDEE
jgi:hypothetical protein